MKKVQIFEQQTPLESGKRFMTKCRKGKKASKLLQNTYRKSLNHGKNIQSLFHILAQFPPTTSESELDYYHQKVNIRVASRFTEQLKTQVSGNQEILIKSQKCFETQPATEMAHSGSCPKKLRKISCKTSHRKTYVT